MSDRKIFRLRPEGVEELEGRSVAVEKSLQQLIEQNLEALLGVRFLASEYSTGPRHRGRLDTLGIDENGYPVIIEYKRSLNENVINQGLFYLDWLMDHQAEFRLLVMETYGKEVADAITWSGPRLLCIAGDFTRYDQYAVAQINRNIELLRYRRYGDDLLLLELVNSSTAENDVRDVGSVKSLKGGLSKENDVHDAGSVKSLKGGPSKGFVELLAQSPPALRDRYEALAAFLTALGDDVQVKQLK